MILSLLGGSVRPTQLTAAWAAATSGPRVGSAGRWGRQFWALLQELGFLGAVVLACPLPVCIPLQ